MDSAKRASRLLRRRMTTAEALSRRSSYTVTKVDGPSRRTQRSLLPRVSRQSGPHSTSTHAPEQGAAYMASARRSQPESRSLCGRRAGPGLLNSSARSSRLRMTCRCWRGRANPPGPIGRGGMVLHEYAIRPESFSRLVAFLPRALSEPSEAAMLVAKVPAMCKGASRPCRRECAMDVWGRSGANDGWLSPPRRRPARQ